MSNPEDIKDDHEKETVVSRNFIENIIDKDLEDGVYSKIVTRFPPEPNGYLHIGHAKSIILNSGLAKEYGGDFHLRFDDTNPMKEKAEFVESIMEDVRWICGDLDKEMVFFASDYFDQMYECAVKLIKREKHLCVILMLSRCVNIVVHSKRPERIVHIEIVLLKRTWICLNACAMVSLRMDHVYFVPRLICPRRT